MDLKRTEEEFRQVREAAAETHRLWGEFPTGLVSVDKVNKGVRKVAGVRLPTLEGVSFSMAPFSMVSLPSWIPAGVSMLKRLTILAARLDIERSTVAELERARRKTTQKVNLYEKVQIPEYRESIRKIKRFLEDDENLSKASQKILKIRLASDKETAA